MAPQRILHSQSRAAIRIFPLLFILLGQFKHFNNTSLNKASNLNSQYFKQTFRDELFGDVVCYPAVPPNIFSLESLAHPNLVQEPSCQSLPHGNKELFNKTPKIFNKNQRFSQLSPLPKAWQIPVSLTC